MNNSSLFSCIKASFRSFFSLYCLIAGLGFGVFSSPAHAACQFFIADADGNPIHQGPTFDGMADGLIRGILDCDGEIHRLAVMTIDIDTKQKYIGVRDDPLFSADVTGALKSLSDVPGSTTSKVHVLGRIDQSPLIGIRRGFVYFATLCDDAGDLTPLNCSWGTLRIKFRTTSLDTNFDEVIDRSYHELSIYDSRGRLHMITFWTPHRPAIQNTTDDWISALRALGLDVTKAG